MRPIHDYTFVACLLAASAGPCLAGKEVAGKEVLATIRERYREESVREVPSFQKHVVPLLGQLGCNGRACHGSFQGRGGFRLSLFGYDFQADHDSLCDQDSRRVDASQPLESLIIVKPTSEDMHEGGQRYERGSWQFHVLRRWVEGGARFQASDVQRLVTLRITPAEIEFQQAGETVQLTAVACWEDGSREDVTPLCRFQSNDDQVATVDSSGLVTAARSGDTHVVAYYDKAVIPVPVLRPVSDLIGAKYPLVAAPSRVDQLVVAKLRKLGIVPADACTDAEFLRRVCLDMTGSLPTAAEVRSFLADPSLDKRQRKIEELLDTPAYAAWWTTKLCDFTGNNEEKLNNVGGVRGRATQDWWDWIHKRVAENAPYDQIAAGIILGKSRDEGESYLEYCESMSAIARGDDGRNYAEREFMPHFWARTNVRLPEERAIAFAYSFLGTRIECAQCHKHPFDQWSKDDFEQFRRFFTTIVANNVNATNLRGEERETYDKLVQDVGINDVRNMNERLKLVTAALQAGKTVPFPETFVNRPNVNNGKKKAAGAKKKLASAKQKVNPRQPGANAAARVLGGEELDLTRYSDPRQPLVDWLREEGNDYFARAFVNRVWASYFHAGIVSPTDDLNLANPPSNKPLLDYLAEGFVAGGYDMKWLHREIANSRTYQLSWTTNATNQHDERNFSHAIPRRLPAEVAVDAVRQATASDGLAASMRSDVRNRAIAIPGASARSNRINRGPNFALGVFGRSTRDSNCDCDRALEASLLQTVYLQNDTDIRTQLDARDSWVNEAILSVARARQTAAAEEATGREASGADANLVAEMKSMQRRLVRARQLENEVQVRRLETQLGRMRRNLAARQNTARESGAVVLRDAPTSGTAVDIERAARLVETAYLRSLSRFPTADEMAITTNYMATESDLGRGLRDVLWALLNTKEFIVNH